MKFAAKEILNGKNLETNLPKLGTGLMSVYNSYSFIRLAMNYYTYYEMVSESSDNDNNLKRLIEKFNDIVKNGVLSPVMGEKQLDILCETEKIRNDVINVMKGLTSLADIFNIYEYALNRIEYNFKDGGHILIESDEAFANSIMAYILSDKDNVVMNTKICETVRELPVRMTKSKFFELLHSGMLVYKDGEKQSINDFLFMLRTTSMLDIDETAFTLSDDIKEIYRDFEKTDFSNITKDQYDDLSDKLKVATSFIENSINKYMMFAELINDVYVIILSNHYVLEFPKEHSACVNIIQTLYQRFLSSNPLGDDVEVENYFMELEGKQEEYYRYFSTAENALEMVLDSYMDQVSALVLDAMYGALKIIRQLESGSIFVEFNSDIDTETATIDYIEEKYKDLKADFEDFFKKYPKLINRAIMAHVLSSLPIFFNNVDEIKGYIAQSISQCSDKAEKLACVEIFHSLMEE